MNKSEAIWMKCRDCCGESPKEVTLCGIVDCSLWPYRFGYSENDRRYLERMGKAEKNFPDEFQEFIQVLSDRVQNTDNPSKNTNINKVLKENLFAIGITLYGEKPPSKRVNK